MGDPLSQESLESFNDELQKLAAGEFLHSVGRFMLNRLRMPKKLGLGALGYVGKHTKGIFEGGDKALQRMKPGNILKGMAEGWRESAPINVMREKAKKLGYGSVQEAAAKLEGQIPPEPAKRPFLTKLKTGPTEEERAYAAAQKAHSDFMQGGGKHLLGSKPGAGRLQRMADELSRQGWTGAGQKTKYLPVGMKSMAVVPAALEIPEIVNAPPPTQTGEGGALERGLGLLGGTAGFVSSTGVGLVPGAAMWLGGQYAGGRLGRILDRLRAGAPLRTAVSAPSPQQAAEQMQDIQKYYG